MLLLLLLLLCVRDELCAGGELLSVHEHEESCGMSACDDASDVGDACLSAAARPPTLGLGGAVTPHVHCTDLLGSAPACGSGGVT